MKAFLGEMERQQLKYRTKRAMEFKKNQGAIVGAIPYGYKRNGNGLEESSPNSYASLSGVTITLMSSSDSHS